MARRESEGGEGTLDLGCYSRGATGIGGWNSRSTTDFQPLSQTGISSDFPDRKKTVFSRFSRPGENRKFPRPGGSRGGPGGTPPEPPFSGVFIRFGRVAWKSICFCVRREGGRFGKIDPRIQWITTFCSFLFVKRRKIAKNRKKTGFPFVPTGRVIKYPKKCTPAGHFSGIFRPHEIPDALGVPFPGYPQAFRPRSEGSRRHDPDSASDIITHLAGHDVFRLGQRRSATSSDVL